MELSRLAAEVRHACQSIGKLLLVTQLMPTQGFFYVVNHTLSSADIDLLFHEAKRFFELPVVRAWHRHIVPDLIEGRRRSEG